MKEAQHAKPDTLMVEALGGSLSRSEIDKAVDEYIEIATMIDDGLNEQVKFDLRQEDGVRIQNYRTWQQHD